MYKHWHFQKKIVQTSCPWGPNLWAKPKFW